MKVAKTVTEHFIIELTSSKFHFIASIPPDLVSKAAKLVEKLSLVEEKNKTMESSISSSIELINELKEDLLRKDKDIASMEALLAEKERALDERTKAFEPSLSTARAITAELDENCVTTDKDQLIRNLAISLEDKTMKISQLEAQNTGHLPSSFSLFSIFPFSRISLRFVCICSLFPFTLSFFHYVCEIYYVL